MRMFLFTRNSASRDVHSALLFLECRISVHIKLLVGDIDGIATQSASTWSAAAWFERVKHVYKSCWLVLFVPQLGLFTGRLLLRREISIRHADNRILCHILDEHQHLAAWTNWKSRVRNAFWFGTTVLICEWEWKTSWQRIRLTGRTSLENKSSSAQISSQIRRQMMLFCANKQNNYISDNNHPQEVDENPSTSICPSFRNFPVFRGGTFPHPRHVGSVWLWFFCSVSKEDSPKENLHCC